MLMNLGIKMTYKTKHTDRNLLENSIEITENFKRLKQMKLIITIAVANITPKAEELWDLLDKYLA